MPLISGSLHTLDLTFRVGVNHTTVISCLLEVANRCSGLRSFAVFWDYALTGPERQELTDILISTMARMQDLRHVHLPEELLRLSSPLQEALIGLPQLERVELRLSLLEPLLGFGHLLQLPATATTISAHQRPEFRNFISLCRATVVTRVDG